MTSALPHPVARLPEEWLASLSQIGERKFRASQVFRWIHQHGVLDPSAMTDLSVALRAHLQGEGLGPVGAIAHQHTAPDGTIKAVLRLGDDASIETVLIPMRLEYHGPRDAEDTAAPELASIGDADLGAIDDEPDEEDVDDGTMERVTQCISSQVGCAMKCAFCASGVPGLRRQLGAEEIVGQVLIGRSLLSPSQRLRNLVFMGSGEPLHNYEAVARAIRLLTHRQGVALSRRRITVSTVGLTDGIARLGEDFEGKVGLAVSLHAADDETRQALVPSNKRWPLASIVKALAAYPLPPRRRITIEYALIEGRNDRLSDARKLAKLLAGLRVKINLIPMNPVDHAGFMPPAMERIQQFRMALVDAGYTCLVRKRRGDDISAACGQLVTRLAPRGKP
ncbi:MAG: 23S rRNA (adenine(2503)-C(2))-methyltransferase RlmN [Deltaproteobacteria bacterium]|nr:23S rRNA (adenine(2503)-C(2))-methyltransferase RlmN [Deltaproteobacteria bacterium]